MSAQKTERSNVIDAAILAEIESLHLAARHTAMGALAGIHRSTGRGTSIEFSEHKVYTPGDDIRHIDWHAFAKTDRFHIKQFEDETNLRLELLVDHSASMGFIGPSRTAHTTKSLTNHDHKEQSSSALAQTKGSKLDMCRTLAAAFAYLALRQGDTTGLTTFHGLEHDGNAHNGQSSGTGIAVLPGRSRSSHLAEILQRLVQLEPAGGTNLMAALRYFAQGQRRRSVVVVLSDLFDPDPALITSLQQLSAQRHDVIVLQVLDTAELEFPFDNPAIFASMEDERRLFVHPRALREAFVAEMKAYTLKLRRVFAASRIDYRLVRSTDDPAKVMGAVLRERQN